MSAPAPLTPRDIATLERAVRRYQTLGFEASLDSTQEAQGRASIWYVDSRDRGSDTFQLNIEKYAGKYGTASWIIRMGRSNGLKMTMTGIGHVSSNILLFALADAERVIRGEKIPDLDPSPEPQEAPVKASRTELVSLDKIAAAILSPEPELPAKPARPKAARRVGRAARPRNEAPRRPAKPDPFAEFSLR